MNHEEVFNGNLYAIINVLNSFQHEAISNELTVEEIEDLVSKITKVLNGINEIPVTNNPNV
ncbi:hypothetical protein PCCS19_33080 [Paenibacillus sp. CCS19]|nr:hypothetical protein PCCS19_33080 [Paenibacillus cellulosilyticus]